MWLISGSLFNKLTCLDVIGLRHNLLFKYQNKSLARKTWHRWCTIPKSISKDSFPQITLLFFTLFSIKSSYVLASKLTKEQKAFIQRRHPLPTWCFGEPFYGEMSSIFKFETISNSGNEHFQENCHQEKLRLNFDEI